MPKQRTFITFILTVLTLIVSACAPDARNEMLASNAANITGGKTPEGVNHTGASNDGRLNELKEELGANSQTDNDKKFATDLQWAKIEPQGQGAYRVRMSFREAGEVTFLYNQELVAKSEGSEIRYKTVPGRDKNGAPSTIEAAMLCKDDCAIATFGVKSKYGAGAKAGLIIRKQDAQVTVRAPPTEQIANPTFKSILQEYEQPQVHTLQSFEVAWGASGFAIELPDIGLCISGRLIETNNVDEALNLQCAGRNAPGAIKAQMIGNTTRGELVLQLSTSRRVANGLVDEEERLYFVIKRRVKAAPRILAPAPSTSAPLSTTPDTVPPAVSETPNGPTDTSSDPSDTSAGTAAPGDSVVSSPSVAKPSTSTKPATKPSTAPSKPATTTKPKPTTTKPAPPAPTAVEDEEDDFDEDAAQPVTPNRTSGWLFPIDPNHAITKVWMRDRKHPVVEAKVQETRKSKMKLITDFALYFPANQKLVSHKLSLSNVTPEFAIISLIESRFFRSPGYPLEKPRNSTALGPWQFLIGTARDQRYGPLKVFAGKPNPCDERADLAKATEAAGKYFRVLLDMFPSDPKLALLGYHWGEGNVLDCLKKGQCDRGSISAANRVRAIQELGLTFWSIRKFNVAPKDKLSYVENFLGFFHTIIEMNPSAPAAGNAPWKSQCRAT